jgi:hypothetical protein
VYRQDRPLTAAAQEMVALLTGKAPGKKAPEKFPHRGSQQKSDHAAAKSIKQAAATEHML